MLQLDSPSEEVQEFAVLALANLAINSMHLALCNMLKFFVGENQSKIIAVGGIRSLFSLLPSKNIRVLQNVTKALANLAVCCMYCLGNHVLMIKQ